MNDYGEWLDIPSSRPGGTHEFSYTVADLTNDTSYTFQVQSVTAANPPQTVSVRRGHRYANGRRP